MLYLPTVARISRVHNIRVTEILIINTYVHALGNTLMIYDPKFLIFGFIILDLKISMEDNEYAYRLTYLQKMVCN